MGDLRIGDKVLDSQGRPCNVLFTTEVQYNRDCYDVLFSDGSAITADRDHRWLTRNYLERRSLDRGTKGVHEPKVRTTEEIRATLKHKHNKNHAVDACGPLDLPPVVLPVDPYLLGIWLGDGSSCDGQITSVDTDVHEAFASEYPQGATTEDRISTRYLGLRAQLKELGVLSNKHIPSPYLRASVAQRLALLQGLMDSDGHASTDNTVEFCSTNAMLAGGVFELAASLGQIPKIYNGIATLYGKDCGPKYRVCFQPSIQVFRLARKAERLRLGRYKQSQIKSRRYIESVTPRESVPVRCITVDSPDHSYLCGKAMITTHNTLLDLLSAMVVRGCKVAVLLLPPNLKAQLIQRDIPFYGQHWKLPNIAGGRWHVPGRPMLHIIAYTELSSAKNSDILSKVKPDLIICDEAHSVRNRSASRTKRFLRYLAANPSTRLLSWSGTLTSRSLNDYAHLAQHALGDGSPVPNLYPVVEEWAASLDPKEFKKPPGALLKLCRPGQKVVDAFRERLIETPGVVTSPDSGGCNASLVISELKVNGDMSKVKVHLDALEETAERPDGEQLVDAMTVAKTARELSSGFFYRWRFPRKEPKEVIDEWLKVRKEWHKELRAKLQHSTEFMDSPLLLTKAAIRWHDGYVHISRDADGHEVSRSEYPPKSRKGPLKVWESEWWPKWKEIRDTVYHETEPVWVDTTLVKECADWLMQDKPGIVWYEFAAFGQALAELCPDVIYCGPGDEGNQKLLKLTGKERCIMSIKAHGTGKDLSMFQRNLVANPPSDGGMWEQLLGRTHRQGQEADEVTVEVFRHTEAFVRAVEKARDLSQYIQDVFGTQQKLASKATWEF